MIIFNGKCRKMQNYKIADISLEGNFQETKKKEKKKKNNKR